MSTEKHYKEHIYIYIYTSSVPFSLCIILYSSSSCSTKLTRLGDKLHASGGRGHIKHTNPYQAVEARSRIYAREPSIQDVYNVEMDCSGASIQQRCQPFIRKRVRCAWKMSENGARMSETCYRFQQSKELEVTQYNTVTNT